MSPAPRGLYAIADADALGSVERVAEAAGEMAAAGVRWIQWRVKRASDIERWRSLEATVRRLEGSQVGLWVDDRVDLAGPQPVFGVHLGQRDLPSDVARTLLPSSIRLARSTHDEPQIDAAAAAPEVDWFAVGPVFATSSKAEPEPTVGLELVAWARQRSPKPLIAIGGIDAANAASVLTAGADLVAVLGAICRGDIGRNTARLLKAIA